MKRVKVEKMILKNVSNLIFAILFLKRLEQVSGQFASSITSENENQIIVDWIIKLSDQILPSAGFFLEKIFSSKLVNNCELKCPRRSNFLFNLNSYSFIVIL